MLSIGAGPAGSPIPSFFNEFLLTRLDSDPAARPDIQNDMQDMKDVDDASYDAVWCKSALDHLYPEDVIGCLRECMRVLKPGGFVMIVVYDARHFARQILNGNINAPMYLHKGLPITVEDQMFGNRREMAGGTKWAAKHCCFAAENLASLLTEVGFERGAVESDDTYMKDSLVAVAFKPDPNKENGHATT